MRAEQDLERAAAGRLARLDVIDRDDALTRAHGRVQVDVAPDRHAHRCQPVGPGAELGLLALEQQRRRAVGQRLAVERAGTGEREQQHVVARVARLDARAGLEPQRLERELGAALRRRSCPLS